MMQITLFVIKSNCRIKLNYNTIFNVFVCRIGTKQNILSKQFSFFTTSLYIVIALELPVQFSIFEIV